MFNPKKGDRIYKNTHLNQEMVNRVKPLMESAFSDEMRQLNVPGRQHLRDERLKFASEQYANRVRVAQNLNQSPLFEDAQIFKGFGLNNLFESVSTPGNVIGMGNVTNPDSSWQHAGGIWNGNYKTGSGDMPTYVFGLQAHLALYCIGFDLIPTIAVDTPKVTLNYVDTVYGGGPMDDATDMPDFVEMSSSILNNTLATTKALKRGVSYLVLDAMDEGVATGVNNAMLVKFIVKSTVKPAYTVQVISTGKFTTSSRTYEATTTKSVKTIVDAVNAQFAVGTVGVSMPKVWVSQTLPGVAPASSDTEITSTVSVNYASAVRTTLVEASTNTGTGKPMSRAQHRKGPVFKLNVVTFDKQVEIEGFEIEADTDNIQIKDMAAMGVNVISRLYNGVQNQLIQSIDETILNHLYACGVQHALNVYLATGQNYSLYIDNPSNTTKAMSSVNVVYEDMMGNDVRSQMGSMPNALLSAAYENQMTHANRLYARLLLIAEFIAQQNRVAGPDYIVAGGALAAAIKKHSSYTASPIPSTLALQPEFQYSGSIFETMGLYKNPRIDFNDPRILLGRRGDDTDFGAKLLAYDLAASRQTLAEQTMAEKIRVWSRFTIADVGFYPELNYYTMVAINGYQWA